MQEVFTESIGFASERVDREASKILGAKLVGLRSKNGRRYTERALQEAAPLYEGAAIYVNHPKDGPKSPRGYQERIAGISNVKFKPGQGLFGDLDVNPKHACAEAAMWDAERGTRGVGFSHNVMCESRRNGDETIIESIVKVHSVDLVAGPATSESFHEQAAANLLWPLSISPDDAEAGRVRNKVEFLDSPGEFRPQSATDYRRIASSGSFRKASRLPTEAKESESKMNSTYENIMGIAKDGMRCRTAILENIGTGSESGELTADQGAVARLQQKVKGLVNLSDYEKSMIHNALSATAVGDPKKASEQFTEQDVANWQPTPADKFRQLSRR